MFLPTRGYNHNLITVLQALHLPSISELCELWKEWHAAFFKWISASRDIPLKMQHTAHYLSLTSISHMRRKNILFQGQTPCNIVLQTAARADSCVCSSLKEINLNLVRCCSCFTHLQYSWLKMKNKGLSNI